MAGLEKFKNEQIRLTADGRWLHGGTEITHERTIDLFNKSIRFQNGRYVLVGEKVPVPVEVEDTAYFVRSLNRIPPHDYEILLSDGSTERLDVTTLDIGSDNGLYCKVKDELVPARFERKAYYDLMKDLTERDGYYGLARDGVFYPIQRKVAFESARQEAKPAAKPAPQKAPKNAVSAKTRKLAKTKAKKGAPQSKKGGKSKPAARPKKAAAKPKKTAAKPKSKKPRSTKTKVAKTKKKSR